MNETAVPVRTAATTAEPAEPLGLLDRPAFDPGVWTPGWSPAEHMAAPWVEEPDVLVELAIRRARMTEAARDGAIPVPAFAGAPFQHGWLARFENLLDRLLPGHLGSLLQLFICVSLTMAMISAMLPLVDRL